MIQGRTVILWVAAGLAIAIVIVLTAAITSGILDDRPMPCAKNHVYVWDDYPNTAHCEAPIK